MITITNDHEVFRRTWNPRTITAEYNSFRIIVTTSDAPTDTAPEDAQGPELSSDVVDRQAVLSLVRSLKAPSLSAPSLANLGINQAWLQNQAVAAATHFGHLGEPNDERQRAFLRKSLTDLTLIGKTIPSVVESRWTDDPAYVQVVVHFANGAVIQAETTNQPAFMLPWTIKVGRGSNTTFNADISRAVAKLLPDGSLNQKRLQGAGLMDQIVSQLDGSVKQRWQEIGAEDKAAGALARIRERYSIRRCEVSEDVDLQVGPPISKPGVEYLQADVRRTGFPQNFLVATVFPLEGGQAVGVDTFLKNGNQYERLVLDNPWVMDSLNRHQKLGAWLMYVGDTSMSEKAMLVFTADMHKLGRDDLAQEVSAQRKKIADLSYYGDEVLLFPDHHAILWRWDPSRDLFRWPASKVKTEECTRMDTPEFGVGCTAAVVDPNGHLKE